MGQKFHFENPYWREKPMSRTTAIQLLFDWEYPMIWALTGHGNEFVRARMDCYSGKMETLDRSIHRINELMDHVTGEIDLHSGLIAFIDLILEPITPQEAKLFGPMNFHNISEFFGPLAARHPEQAIQTCFGFMHVHDRFLFTPARKTVFSIHPARPRKWYNFFYRPVPIRKKETVFEQPASMFKDVLLSVPYPQWRVIASPFILKPGEENEEDTESVFALATAEHMLRIEGMIPKTNTTLLQYHCMLDRLHKAGLNS